MPACRWPACGARTGPGCGGPHSARALFWNWQWDPERYPDLPRRIVELGDRGIPIPGLCQPVLQHRGLRCSPKPRRWGCGHPGSGGRDLSRRFRRVRRRNGGFHQPGRGALVHSAHPEAEHAGPRHIRLGWRISASSSPPMRGCSQAIRCCCTMPGRRCGPR